MKRGDVPFWLLRNVPALVGLAWSFCPLVIMMISSGRRAILGRKTSPRAFECIMHMLSIAEAHLNFALSRLGWRALGWNVREVQLEILPPITNWTDVAARFEVYRADMMGIAAASTRFTEGLRHLYCIRSHVDPNSVYEAHPSTDAARSGAARHELVGPHQHLK